MVFKWSFSFQNTDEMTAASKLKKKKMFQHMHATGTEAEPLAEFSQIIVPASTNCTFLNVSALMLYSIEGLKTAS